MPQPPECRAPQPRIPHRRHHLIGDEHAKLLRDPEAPHVTPTRSGDAYSPQASPTCLIRALIARSHSRLANTPPTSANSDRTGNGSSAPTAVILLTTRSMTFKARGISSANELGHPMPKLLGQQRKYTKPFFQDFTPVISEVSSTRLHQFQQRLYLTQRLDNTDGLLLPPVPGLIACGRGIHRK